MTDISLLENADRPVEFNRRTLPRLCEYLRQKAYLIVLDNLEGLLTPTGDWRAPEWGSLMEALLNPQSQSRLILTSRYIPNALADLPQLQQVVVHALSLPEAVLLARELPNLSKLFADDVGRHLLQWTLRLVQGHPKLLEFADKLAADRTLLQEQLTNAEFAEEANSSLQAFFETGESARGESQFLKTLTRWTHDLKEKCTPVARLLFQFLAWMEEDDRYLHILETVWSAFLSEAADDQPGIAEARRNTAQSLNEGLQELMSLGLIALQNFPTMKDAPITPSTRFLMRRGFTETNRTIRMRLAVAHASLSALPVLTARLDAQGISVVTLAQEQARTPDWLAKILSLFRATGPERVGNPYGIGTHTEFWSAEVAERIWESTHPLSADAFFLAVKGDAYVGLSLLCLGEAPSELARGETGVHVDWRRQGIATLLKLHTIAYALQHGYDEITTMTASPGMLALNERLGFQQGWAEVRLVKDIMP